jgi:hypothetical protein
MAHPEFTTFPEPQRGFIKRLASIFDREAHRFANVPAADVVVPFSHKVLQLPVAAHMLQAARTKQRITPDVSDDDYKRFAESVVMYRDSLSPSLYDVANFKDVVRGWARTTKMAMAMQWVSWTEIGEQILLVFTRLDDHRKQTEALPDDHKDKFHPGEPFVRSLVCICT